MGAYKSPEVGPDVPSILESRCSGCRFLIFLRDVGTFRVVLEIPVEPDSKQIPGRAFISYEDKVVGLAQGPEICILHLALLIQVGPAPRQGLKHLHVKERRAFKGLLEILERWTVDENLLLPIDVSCDALTKVLIVSPGAAGASLRAGDFRLATQRKQLHRVQGHTLALSHSSAQAP